jgi:hypothetical protein
MGDDQTNWSAPCGRTCSGITIWRKQRRNNNPPPDITSDQRQNNIRQSQLYSEHNTEETEVFSTSAFPSTDSTIQIIFIAIVIFRKVLDSHKMQEQQQSCQVRVSCCNVKC